MSVLDLARVVIYRFHEKGLEIFLIQNDMEKDPDVWKIPEGALIALQKSLKTIDLEEVVLEDGRMVKTLAIEGDWHDIPSIRGMLKHDVKLVKSIVKENLPGLRKVVFLLLKKHSKKYFLRSTKP
jgi:hypothetical protein